MKLGASNGLHIFQWGDRNKTRTICIAGLYLSLIKKEKLENLSNKTAEKSIVEAKVKLSIKY